MSRAIDALVAEHVMGLKVHEDAIGIYVIREGRASDVEHYSTDIAAAWEVVDTGVLNGLQLNIWGDSYDIIMDEDEWSQKYSDASTASMAICLAALKAKGIEVPDDI